MIDWRPIETAPTSGTFLVWLSRPKFGSHIFPMRADGVGVIGTSFHFDMPKPTHWAPSPCGPSIKSEEGSDG